MIVYIDGDNTPDRRIDGIELLSEKDAVCIFYSINMKHFDHQSVRDSICKRVKSALSFHSITSGKDAVDFAIAVDLAIRIANGEKAPVIMVSGDKHFEVIRQQIMDRFPQLLIRKDDSIRSAMDVMYITSADTAGSLKKSLCRVFGATEGKRTYQKLKSIFKDSESRPQEAECEIIPLLRRIEAEEK